MLVRNGVIQAFGTNPADVPNATGIDLNGSFVYPGFHDTHVHLVEAGYGFCSGCFLYGATDADTICNIVRPIADNFRLVNQCLEGFFLLKIMTTDLSQTEKNLTG